LDTYNYPSPSIIDKVTFVKGDDGGVCAYLHAREGADHAKLDEISQSLQNARYPAVATEFRGQPVLEARGFLWQGKCIDLLKEQGYVSGTPNIEKTEEKEISFVDKVKRQSLFASGLLYVLGDIKFISYGIKGSSPLNIAGGIGYASGTALNLLFNRKSNADLKIHDVAQQMADHVNALNITIPKDAALGRITEDKDKSIIQSIDEWARHYPAELMHAGFAVAGACIAVAAYKQLGHSKLPAGQIEEYLAKQMKAGNKVPSFSEADKLLTRAHKASNWLDVGLGSMTMASGAFAALVPEKARDPDSPKKEGMAGWWEWMQERPLTIAGTGLMISTLCHAASTGIEYKLGRTDAKSAIIDRGVFVATNLLAEFLITISSKGHGEGVKSDPTLDNSAMSIAAELIARQPVEKQPELTSYMAKFLGRPDVLAIDDKEAERLLANAVEVTKNNPWAMATKPDAATQQKAELASKELAAWQAKMAAQPETPHHLGA